MQSPLQQATINHRLTPQIHSVITPNSKPSTAHLSLGRVFHSAARRAAPLPSSGCSDRTTVARSECAASSRPRRVGAPFALRCERGHQRNQVGPRHHAVLPVKKLAPARSLQCQVQSEIGLLHGSVRRCIGPIRQARSSPTCAERRADGGPPDICRRGMTFRVDPRGIGAPTGTCAQAATLLRVGTRRASLCAPTQYKYSPT